MTCHPGPHFLTTLGYREACSTPRTRFFCREDVNTQRSWL